eukprot:6345833-Amphidinium_carterae.1
MGAPANQRYEKSIIGKEHGYMFNCSKFTADPTPLPSKTTLVVVCNQLDRLTRPLASEVQTAAFAAYNLPQYLRALSDNSLKHLSITRTASTEGV